MPRGTGRKVTGDTGVPRDRIPISLAQVSAFEAAKLTAKAAAHAGAGEPEKNGGERTDTAVGKHLQGVAPFPLLVDRGEPFLLAPAENSRCRGGDEKRHEQDPEQRTAETEDQCRDDGSGHRAAGVHRPASKGNGRRRGVQGQADAKKRQEGHRNTAA